MELYRIISFEDFVNLIFNGKDRFSNRTKWPDEYEGYTYSWLTNTERILKVINEIKRRNQDDVNKIVSDISKMWSMGLLTYAQCWTKYSETDAMWRCYSYGNKGIRIRTTKRKLISHAKRAFKNDPCKTQVVCDEVKYDLLTEDNALEYQMSQIYGSKKTYEPYFHKRDVFKHEGEYRLLVMNSPNTLAGIMKLYVTEELKNGELNDRRIAEEISKFVKSFDDREYPDTIIKRSDDAKKYINGVMVHPEAKTWFVDIVKEICEKNHIVFDGQSKIYKLQQD